MIQTAKRILDLANIAVPILTAVLALTTLGLAADNIYFAYDHRTSDFAVNSRAWEDSTHSDDDEVERLAYSPGLTSYDRLFVLVAIGIICACTNVIVAGMLVWKKGNTRKTLLLAAAIAIDALLLIVSLGASIYVWQVHGGSVASTIRLARALITGVSRERYDKFHPMDVVNWNCGLYPFVSGEFHTYSEHAAKGYIVQHGARQLSKDACHKGMAAVDLMIPIVLLQAVTLGVHIWTWRNDKIAAQAEIEPEDKQLMKEQS